MQLEQPLQALHRRPLELSFHTASENRPGNSSDSDEPQPSASDEPQSSASDEAQPSASDEGHSTSDKPMVASSQPPMSLRGNKSTALSLRHTFSTLRHRLASTPLPTLPISTLVQSSPLAPSADNTSFLTHQVPLSETKTAHSPSTAPQVTTHHISSHIKFSATEQVSLLGSRGFVLAENYYEQQTMALRNMMQLQCWAQSLKLLVVKPVTHDSFLKTPLDSTQQKKFLNFGDSFDEEEWAQQAERLGYAPLISWDDFLRHAPRDVVVVQFEHPSVSTVKARQKSGQGILHTAESHQRYTTGCSGKWPTARDMNFLRSNRFHVVRSVCFNFYYGDQLSLEAFNQHLLGGLSPNSVTIILETWRGISTAQRVLLKGVCQNTALVQEHISLSPWLAQQADQYTHKYLGGSRQYLAIMGRLEITQLTVHKKVPVVPYCLEETLSQWRQFKTDSKLERTFLSIDIGRYGSKKYRSGVPAGIGVAFSKFFQTLFGGSVSEKEWERRFELVAGNKDAGYIGLLQKLLVTRAQCILFVGGGAFQRHALYLYKQLHPDPQDQCYHIVKQCTRTNKLS